MRRTRFLPTVVVAAVASLGLCASAHADLINYWKFDEAAGATAAIDSGTSSNLLNLDLQGNAAFVHDTARGGQVLELDGDGDYASNTGEPFTTDIAHTVGVWVNHFDETDLTQRWLSWGAKSGGRYFLGPNADGSLSGHIHAGAATWSAFYTQGAAKPAANTWQYWAFVREGTDARLYVDGEHVQTLTVSNVGGSINSAGELRVGQAFADYGQYLNGRMDDLAIWNEALTPEQIISAMNYGAANYMIPEPSSAVLLSFAVMAMLLGLGSRRRVIG